MPELALFLIGAVVTVVAIFACVLVGRAEAADARRAIDSPPAGAETRTSAGPSTR